jgi:hypothetical protein
MIQRIQTLYLVLVTVLSGLLLNGGLVTFTGTSELFSLSVLGISIISGNDQVIVENTVPLMILLNLIPLLSLITIFVFKKRNLQLKFTMLILVLIIVSIIAGVYYALYVSKKFGTEIIFNVKMIFPILSAIFAYLAYRGIRKDEQLVNSYDRLR